MLSLRAQIRSVTGRFNEAESLLSEPLAIFQELAKKEPVVYQGDVATSLTAFATLYEKTGRLREAVKYTRDSVDILRNYVALNRFVAQPLLASGLTKLATLYAATGSIDLALKSCEEALTIYTDLTTKLAWKYAQYVPATQANIGFLYEALEKNDSAAQALRAAVQGYRSFGPTEAYDRSMLAKSLASLARIDATRGKLPDAEKEADEAIMILRDLRKSGETDDGDDLARSLILSATLLEKKPNSGLTQCALLKEASEVAKDKKIIDALASAATVCRQ